MRISFFIFLFLSTLILQGQHTISGTFSPAKEYTWLIAYHLRPDGQNYIADTAIKKGKFSLAIPANKPKGIYRLVYAVPQEEFYFDVIYNGSENIELDFKAMQGVSFTSSAENIPYATYFDQLKVLQQELHAFYASGSTDMKAYKTLVQRLSAFQEMSEEESKGLLANHFISANKPYVPSKYESLTDYVSNKKAHYFDELNINDTLLQASDFLTEKLTNFVFTALPTAEITPEETERTMQENLRIVADKLSPTNSVFKYTVFNKIWLRASSRDLNGLSDYIYSNYLKELAVATDNTKTILDVEKHNRLRIGAVAPEIEWKENNVTHKLSNLEGAKQYLLVFWSSQCGHCLKQLPELHKDLIKHPGVKVLAVGLENDDVTWKKESAKLPNFSHAISLGKWESTYADLYDVHHTPTYYVLDAEKHIVAEPEGEEDVMTFLLKNQ